MKYLLPIVFLAILIYALVKKVRPYDAFVEGAKGAIPFATRLFPYLATIFILTELFEVSGLSNAVTKLLSPVFNILGIPSEEKFKYRGISACAVCDGNFYRNQDVCIIGGGDSAMEEADALSKIANKIYLIHRRDHFNASPIMIDRVTNNPKIEKIFNSSVIEFLGEQELSGVKILNSLDNTTREIPLQGAFVALGYIPATQIFKDYLTLDSQGFIILKDKSSENILIQNPGSSRITIHAMAV